MPGGPFALNLGIWEHRSNLNPSPRKGTVMHPRLLNLQLKFARRLDDRGATAVEYGLMVALIAIVIIVAVSLLGTNLSSIFNSTASAV
jgi:pilus assembly protein Flp/PilA